MGMNGYPLVNVEINELEYHRAINGKTHYSDWAMFNSYFDITRGYTVHIVTFIVSQR